MSNNCNAINKKYIQFYFLIHRLVDFLLYKNSFNKKKEIRLVVITRSYLKNKL